MLRNLPSPVPPFFFPTRVIHVDDHETYLRVMRPHLEPDVFVEGFASAGDALDAIDSARGGPAALAGLVHHRKDAHGTDNELVLDVAMIKRIMYDERRFAMPSVLVADYAMPEMTGLNFLQTCGTANIGRVLLTGQADKATVIKAFNDGLIDRYIEKSDSSAPDVLMKTIAELQWRYFARAFSTVSHALSREDYRVLWDREAMETIIKSLNIEPVEMYLVPEPTGLLFLDGHGEAEFVVVVSDTQLMKMIDEGEKQSMSDDDLARMGSEEAVPVLHDGEKAYSADPVNYDMIPVETLRTGEGSYHIGRLEDLARFQLDQVMPYERWLDEREGDNAGDPAFR